MNHMIELIAILIRNTYGCQNSNNLSEETTVNTYPPTQLEEPILILSHEDQESLFEAVYFILIKQ